MKRHWAKKAIFIPLIAAAAGDNIWRGCYAVVEWRASRSNTCWYDIILAGSWTDSSIKNIIWRIRRTQRAFWSMEQTPSTLDEYD